MKKISDFYQNNSADLDRATKEILPALMRVQQKYGNDGLIQYAYQMNDEIQKKIGLSELTTCSKQQCSFCCHSTINISHGEAKYIRKKIKENGIKPDKKRSKIQNSANMSAENEQSLKWVDRACPFLSSTDGKGDCTIYEIRPLLCRNHNSMQENFNDCNKEDDYHRWIKEGRHVALEAVTIAVMLLTQEETPMTPIHKIF
jgi:Fe-S-cluster containining protein